MVSFTPLPLYPREKSPRYPSDKRLGKPKHAKNISQILEEFQILAGRGRRVATIELR
jgi:hypothetical protein